MAAPVPACHRVLPVLVSRASALPNASPVKVSYLAFLTLDTAKPLQEAGVLRIPVDAAHPMPAVVIVHGSAGIDSRVRDRFP